MGNLVDSHCHLDFEAFDGDRERVIDSARQAGIIRIMNPGTDLESSRAAIKLSQVYPEVYAAVGVHPNEAQKSWNAGSLEEIKALAGEAKVVAIGETGLDYYREWTPPGLQKEVFEAQLELAGEAGLPVVVHSRQAMGDTLAMLADWVNGLRRSGSRLAGHPGVLHSYSGSPEEARLAVELGFMIGVTGPVTFKDALALQETAAELPLDVLLVETDAPFMAPQPKRGQRNQPAYVAWVAQKIAEIRGCPEETVRERTTANANRLFNWENLPGDR